MSCVGCIKNSYMDRIVWMFFNFGLKFVNEKLNFCFYIIWVFLIFRMKVRNWDVIIVDFLFKEVFFCEVDKECCVGELF